MNWSISPLIGMIFSCRIVFSIGDLHDPVQYVDRAQSNFIGINAGKYRMGTAMNAVKNASEDLSQVSGEIEDCSTQAYWCKSIAFLKFIVPKTSVHAVTYDAGSKITIERLTDGDWHASATCWRLLPSGCADRVNGGSPMVTYDYEVNRAGVLMSVNIRYFDSRGVLADHDDLRLSTKLGLRLK